MIPTLRPPDNVCPLSFQPVVRLDSETGERELTVMRWGLVRFGRRTPKLDSTPTTPEQRPSPPVRHSARHSIAVAALFPQTFSEWKKLDAEAKQPYGIALKDGPLFAFAGLWKRWKDKLTGQTLETYTIVTTAPNELISGMAIHDRMPVILKPARLCPVVGTRRPAEAPR